MELAETIISNSQARRHCSRVTLFKNGKRPVPFQPSLIPLPQKFAVCRLGPEVSLPAWATEGDFFSVTRTADELSLVCCQNSVPEGTRCERDWRCLRIAGTIPLSVVGVVAGLTTALAASGISVFVVSTFDTDYLLVKERDWEAALEALGGRGYLVRDGA
jgi:hypothetical protein